MPERRTERILPRGTLYLWPEGVLFIGTDMFNEMHRHFTASVSFALNGEFLVHTPPDSEPRGYQGLLVAPNIEQLMDARGAEVVILQVDPETDDYGRLAERFSTYGQVHTMDPDTIGRLRKHAREMLESHEFSPTELWEEVVRTLEVRGSRPGLDPRIRRVLALIKQDTLAPPTAAELASRVRLSEGRLIHLFTEQMGLPIRRYTLWLRLRDAFLNLAEGCSLTEAAHRAGFSDSAHLSRTFRGMFGIPPSFFAEGRGQVRTEFVVTGGPQQSPHPFDEERWKRIAARKGG